MPNPKTNSITFVIPAFNCQDTITETVTSIFEGNFSEGDEVIIINDASTDDTAAVLEELKTKFPAILIFAHNTNKGSAAAGRNTGIDQSSNELIFTLDADNVLSSGSVPLLKQHLLEKKADAAAFGEIHYFKEKEKEKVKFKWVLDSEISLYVGLNCIDRNPLSSGNYLFTRESWRRAGRYNESVGGAWDSWAFGFCQLVTGSKMVTLYGTHYYHRYGYESTYFREIKKSNASLTALRIVLPYIDLFDDTDVDYIMSREGRHTWVDHLPENPVRLKDKAENQVKAGIGTVAVNNGVGKSSLVKRLIKAVIREIKA